MIIHLPVQCEYDSKTIQSNKRFINTISDLGSKYISEYIPFTLVIRSGERFHLLAAVALSVNVRIVEEKEITINIWNTYNLK